MDGLTPGETSVAWLVSEDAMDQILELYLAVGSPSNQAVAPPDWFQAGDGRDTGASILGIPAVVTDHQPTAGTPGDVMLGDLALYLYGSREEMTVEVSSRGAGWVSDTSNIRVRSRVDGRYWPQSSYTLANGKVTSPLVVLQ
jgi:HK97 family phage major capsid protein